MAKLDVTFTDDIPKIEREGFQRESKYTPLLNACVERPGKAARIVVESQGQASSRASSIKDAALKHEGETEGKGLFTVATRSGDEGEFFVYCQFNAEGTDGYKEEQKRRNRSKDGDEVVANDEEDEAEETPAPRKTAAKKTAKKAAKRR